MKYIILFLFATLANADVYIQRISNEQLGNGYILAFPKDGVIQCIGFPELLDLTVIPQTLMIMQDAALAYSWPLMTVQTVDICRSLNVPRTINNASWGFSYLYPVSIAGGIFTIGAPVEIPENTPCGDRVGATVYQSFAMHSVIYNGVAGMAVCK